MPAETPSHDDNTTITNQPPPAPACPVCWTTFRPVGRRRFCCDNCRKTAWARRQAHTSRPVEPIPPPGRRRDSTVYACPTCDTRYFGEQWCHDCNQPCTRVGIGGLCPHCDEPVAFTDLLDQPKEAQNR